MELTNPHLYMEAVNSFMDRYEEEKHEHSGSFRMGNRKGTYSKHQSFKVEAIPEEEEKQTYGERALSPESPTTKMALKDSFLNYKLSGMSPH